MRCHSCGRDNRENYVLCACGERRIVDLSTGTAQSAPAPGPSGGPQQRRFARDATRYLCAAVQTDDALRGRAMNEIVHESKRAIATSPGIDLATVLKYALHADRRKLARDAVLAGLSILLFESLVPVLLERPPHSFTELLSTMSWPLVAAWLVVLLELLWTHYGVLAPRLRRHNFNPAKAPRPRSASKRARLDQIAQRDRGNLAVFGTYQPFIGHGQPFSAWSFTLKIAPEERGDSVIPFTVHELHEHIEGVAQTLGLPGVTVEHCLFVNGKDVLHHFEPPVRDAILPDPMGAPAAEVDDGLIARLREELGSRARPYLAIRVHSWSGELVTTMFLRFAMPATGNMLFVEASYSLLAPVREQYREVDQLRRTPTLRQVARLAGRCAWRSPLMLVFSSISVLSQLLRPVRHYLQDLRDTPAVMRERTFNYGATVSLREAASDDVYYRYFQQLDNDMNGKLVERRLIDSLATFLQDHNVDVSELIERQTTILNNGIYVAGSGTLTARNVAAGAGASASSARTPRTNISTPGANKAATRS